MAEVGWRQVVSSHFLADAIREWKRLGCRKVIPVNIEQVRRSKGLLCPRDPFGGDSFGATSNKE